MRRQCRVRFFDHQTKIAYDELDSRKESSDLKKNIQRALEAISQDAFCGIQIPKRLIPQVYRKRGINNVWKYNLPNAWRLLYTVENQELMIVSIILEWIDHKEYERRFRY